MAKTIKEMIEIMEAFADGKKIEFRVRKGPGSDEYVEKTLTENKITSVKEALKFAFKEFYKPTYDL